MNMATDVKRPSDKGVDPVTFQVVKASLSGIVQEMQNALFRTGYSTIIRESQDASCAMMNADGDVVAQHVVLPLHIGAFPACTAAVIRDYKGTFKEGDAFLINHTYEGGSPHAPDMAVITPIFAKDRLIGFCGTLAHKSDIGGPVPGSCFALAREIFAEGIHFPAVRFVQGGEINREIERILAANSRTPELVLGDLRGQLGADRLGERRVAELVSKYVENQLLACFDQLMSSSEAQLRAAIAEWPDGRYEGERFMDNDGITLNKPIRIHVVIDKKGDRIAFDYTGCDDQTLGPANIRPPLVQAAIAYCLISQVDPNIAVNSGVLRVADLKLREGSVVNPRYPASLNTYNPTVHAVIEATLAALAPMVPDHARGDGCGSRSIIIGGRSTRAGKGYVQYEIVSGGTGGRPGKDGMSGSAVHVSNSKIASVEIVESEFPTRLKRFELVQDSAGPGAYRGGLGVRREYINLGEARFNIRSTKHEIPPMGVLGGGPARTGKLTMKPGTAEEKVLPSRYSDYPLKEGDVFRLETPGGGGFGDPLARDAASVVADINEGYVSVDRAAADYGVVVFEKDGDWILDEAATKKRRQASAH
jgi:N-methylhydantoinase B